MSHKRTPIIGLTGGIGSGKTAVSDRLAENGAVVVDTDRIAHDLTAPQGMAIAHILEHFGPESITSEGALNRAWMRDRVFKHPEQRRVLESILHPMIREVVMENLAQPIESYFVLVIPLLIEKGGWLNLLDEILVVDCDPELQIQRVMNRSKLSRDEVERILATQASRKARLEAADHVIENNGSLVQLLEKTDLLHEVFLKLPLN